MLPRYRQRLRSNSTMVTVEVGPEHIDALRRRHYLLDDEFHSRGQIKDAVEGVLAALVKGVQLDDDGA